MRYIESLGSYRWPSSNDRTVCKAPLKLSVRGLTSPARAASAMIPRIRLYASRWSATSLRTIAGLWVRNCSICISVFNVRRSNSFFQP